jgi:hypothetical protein
MVTAVKMMTNTTTPKYHHEQRETQHNKEQRTLGLFQYQQHATVLSRTTVDCRLPTVSNSNDEGYTQQ